MKSGVGERRTLAVDVGPGVCDVTLIDTLIDNIQCRNGQVRDTSRVNSVTSEVHSVLCVDFKVAQNFLIGLAVEEHPLPVIGNVFCPGYEVNVTTTSQVHLARHGRVGTDEIGHCVHPTVCSR